MASGWIPDGHAAPQLVQIAVLCCGASSLSSVSGVTEQNAAQALV